GLERYTAWSGSPTSLRRSWAWVALKYSRTPADCDGWISTIFNATIGNSCNTHDGNLVYLSVRDSIALLPCSGLTVVTGFGKAAVATRASFSPGRNGARNRGRNKV